MGGGGSLDSMNKTIQRNRALLNRKTVFKNKDQRRYEKPLSIKSDHKEEAVDPKILDQVKTKVLRERRWRFMKSLVIFIAVALMIGFAMFQLMNGPPPGRPF